MNCFTHSYTVVSIPKGKAASAERWLKTVCDLLQTLDDREGGSVAENPIVKALLEKFVDPPTLEALREAWDDSFDVEISQDNEEMRFLDSDDARFNPTLVGMLIWSLLNHLDLTEQVQVTWANTGDKHREGVFSGGRMLVTRYNYYTLNVQKELERLAAIDDGMLPAPREVWAVYHADALAEVHLSEGAAFDALIAEMVSKHPDVLRELGADPSPDAVLTVLGKLGYSIEKRELR